MSDNLSPYLRNSSDTIILLKLRIEEINRQISYLYDHYVHDSSLGLEFYWDASNFLRVRGGSSSSTGDWKRYVDGSLYALKEYTDLKWRNIQRHGFTDPNETSLTYDPITRQLQLVCIDSSWNFMQDGSLYNAVGSRTIELHDGTSFSGKAYVYVDSSAGDLHVSDSGPNLIDSKVTVAEVVWNDLMTPNYLLVDDRHTALIDKRMRHHLRNVIGPRVIGGGEVHGFMVGSSTNISDESLVPSQFDNSSGFNTFGVSPTTMVTEDIIIDIPEIPKPSVSQLAYNVFFRLSSSEWQWGQSSLPYLYDGTSIKWDDGGSLSDVSSNYFTNTYLLFTNIDGSMGHVMVPGQAQYERLSDAVSESPVVMEWDGFPTDDFVVGWQFTWESSANFVTMPGRAALASEPKRVNVSPRVSGLDSFSVVHNFTGGLQGGNGIDEYYHVSDKEKKAIAILAPDVSKLQDVISDVRWLPTDSSYCEVMGGYNTGTKIVVFKEQKRLEPSDWTDTGRTEERSSQDVTSCPIVPYRAAMSVGAQWDSFSSVDVPFSFGVQTSLNTPVNSGYNFLFLSIPSGRSFSVSDGAGFDISGSFVNMGIQDNVPGYRQNIVYRKNPKFASSKSLNFKLTII